MVFYHHFSVLQNAFMNRLEFFCKDFETGEEYGFL
jgi:hypothetical protein